MLLKEWGFIVQCFLIRRRFSNAVDGLVLDLLGLVLMMLSGADLASLQ